MKNYTQKFIALFALLFAISFTISAQDNKSIRIDHGQIKLSSELEYYGNDGITFLLKVKQLDSDNQHFIDIGGFPANDENDDFCRFVIKHANGLIYAWVEGPLWTGIASTMTYDISNYTNDTWFNIGASFSKTNSYLYINDTLVDSLSYNYSSNVFINSNADNIISGNDSYGSGYLFNGFIDDFQIWPSIIEPQSFNDNVFCSMLSTDESPIGYWDFNETSQMSENIIIDKSGNYYHGEIIGNCVFSDDHPEEYTCPLLLNDLTDQEISYVDFFNNSYYYISNYETSWHHADSISSSLGGHLVSINSEDENNFVQSFLNGQNAWIGLNDSLIEGDWVWSSGELFDYNNWATGEPNNDDMLEHFVHTNYSGNGDWNDDTDETSQFLFVIEVKAIFGCLDSEAFNYNEEANTEDYSCYPMIYGCINPIAANYVNPIGDIQIDVNTDDGSCLYSSDVYDNILEDLSVFETVEEEQDYSMSFDGIDDWVNLNTWSLGQVFTIEMWVNPDSIQNSPIPNILDCSHNQWRNWTIQKLSSWSFGFGTLQNETISYFNLDDNNWNHIAIVFDHGLSNIYLNGELVSSQMLGLITYNSPLNLNLGKWSLDSGNGGGRFFTGLIDDIRISDYARYSNTFYPCKTLIPDENTISLWNFNEGSGDTVYDLSGNGNHGIIYGAEFSEDVPESFNGCTDVNALNFDESALCDNGSCVYGDDVVSNLEEDLSVFETVDEEQDYSMSFDGVDGYTEINPNDDFIFDNGFNISFWGKTNRDNDSESFIYFRNDNLPNNPIIYIRHSEEDNNIDQVNVRGTEAQYYDDIELPENEWFHFSIDLTRNTNENIDAISIYLNGNLINQSEFDNIGEIKFNDNTIETSGIRFGAAPHETWDNLQGFINNVQVWNRSISQEQIQSYMSCPPTGEEEGLVGYWNFNEGSGDTVYDISGNGNHGVINGAEFSDDVPESFNGCTDANALNYDATAQCDNGSCVYGDDEYSAIGLDLDNTNSTLNNVLDTWQSSVDLTTSTLDEVSLINQTLSNFNTVIDLTEGWNMFGYGCPQPMDVSEGLSNYTDLIIITKDNYGNVYMPEFDFNGIGTFSPGYGYQIKISEAIEGFSLCGDFINIDNTQILDIETDNAQMQNDINCLTGNPEIGDYCYGGIVFYVEEGVEGKYGLVAAIEDLPGTYEWGCYQIAVDGADEHEIGNGYQNTIDVLTQNCQPQNGGITASQAVASLEREGYSDWFLPSILELTEMWNTIGNGGNNGNPGNFLNIPPYWSSTEQEETNPGNSLALMFLDGSLHGGKFNLHNVRPIRSFGNWIMGCMDSLACNYSPEANMADGSCTYAQEGYDCDGNIQTSLSFDGIQDYVMGPASNSLDMSLTNSFTISAKIFIKEEESIQQRIFALGQFGIHNHQYALLIDASKKIYFLATNDFEINGDHNIGNQSLSIDEWSYITVSYDGETLRFFINGVLDYEKYIGLPISSNYKDDFIIGARGDLSGGGGGFFPPEDFNGLIDHIEVWNQHLSQEQIQLNMICSPNTNEVGLVGYWDFNEGEGNTVYDLSGNENHGTINGASYSTDTSGDNCE